MCHLTHVTFTGVDDRTDLGRLKEIAGRYPFAEFGVLMARSGRGGENRFPDVQRVLKGLDGAGVRLSAHLCGALARDIVRTGDFSEFRLVCGIRSDLFSRCQLNVAGMGIKDPAWFLYFPTKIRQVIVQQSSREVFAEEGGSLYAHFASYNPLCSLLLDDSGGRGRRGTLRFADAPVVGYAGGIGPENVTEVLTEILAAENVRDFWIDMETGVRTDDWFDLDKVEAVCAQVEQMLNGKNGS